MPSSEFRRRYASLKEPTAVTVNNHIIGVWEPAPQLPSLRTIKRWVKEDREIAPLSLPAEERKRILTTRDTEGRAAAQAQRDDLLRKINRRSS